MQRLPCRIDRELTAALKRFSQQHGVTLFMTLLAAWAALLVASVRPARCGHRYADCQSSPAEIEALIGFFVNTLALRVDLSANPALATCSRASKTPRLQAQAHQDLPFEQVVEIVKPPRSLARHARSSR